MKSEKVLTEEVKSWKGIHLLHFQTSSCSQKVRLLLNELDLDWNSHPINLLRKENATPWFLGINPRGVVPVLVDDGEVHVESNDILKYLDQRYSRENLSYFFDNDQTLEKTAQHLLDHEGSLHQALRILTIAFGPLKIKNKESIEDFERNGPSDVSKKRELDWWKDKLDQGMSDDEISAACQSYFEAFTKLDLILEKSSWLVGNQISIVDIAWFSDIQRLYSLGYPLKTHPNLYTYFLNLSKRNAFKSEMLHSGALVGRCAFFIFKILNRLKGKSIERSLNKLNHLQQGM